MKPKPVPTASRSERLTVLRLANASWRPRIMQFTTIRAMNAPSALCSPGVSASSVMSAIVTNVAMIRMYVEIRTSWGISLRSSDTNRLEPVRTKNVARPMARLFATVFVTASAGQSPRSCTSTGFSRHTPRMRSSVGVRCFIARTPPDAVATSRSRG